MALFNLSSSEYEKIKEINADDFDNAVKNIKSINSNPDNRHQNKVAINLNNTNLQAKLDEDIFFKAEHDFVCNSIEMNNNNFEIKSKIANIIEDVEILQNHQDLDDSSDSEQIFSTFCQTLNSEPDINLFDSSINAINNTLENKKNTKISEISNDDIVFSMDSSHFCHQKTHYNSVFSEAVVTQEFKQDNGDEKKFLQNTNSFDLPFFKKSKSKEIATQLENHTDFNSITTSSDDIIF
ncbi:uncharacterized protein ASCRUDRAFT_72892 [Ascoidea rubescens DSM 1968]|uniref:Uncharacterized protein n=1 Tax=Ascoidea rubescens DSM 1968 TaxID=1344418 RepID=A0A1D2V8T6_9ASCO|nr:hypothetical protein ASCRUDRAFT_72892 [Ascoidea rubescens DSM 1968]ODV58028.1 hypothetical protein ASCRUDRAFT_72892 [Ascoidea rubescens DSM 1968]